MADPEEEVRDPPRDRDPGIARRIARFPYPPPRAPDGDLRPAGFALAAAPACVARSIALAHGPSPPSSPSSRRRGSEQVDFDPTLKKKKKKKVILEDADDEAVEAVTGEMDDLDVEGFGKKKKKKSKSKEAGEEGEDAGDDEGFGKKKKKKKKKKGSDDEDEAEAGEDAGAGAKTGSGLPWDGTTRDYHYDELLGRVFGILREKNPALSEKTKTIIKPPQVLREGTKKTVFANLMESTSWRSWARAAPSTAPTGSSSRGGSSPRCSRASCGTTSSTTSSARCASPRTRSS